MQMATLLSSKFIITWGLFFLMLFSYSANAQQGNISGKVTSQKDGQGIQHVHILIAHTDLEVETNIFGEFEFSNMPYRTYSLEFRYDGKLYDIEELEVKAPLTKIDVSLDISMQFLDEVWI